MAPDAFRSYLKLVASTTCPARNLTPLMSAELTEPLSFMSPIKNPTDTVPITIPLLPVTVILARLLSATPLMATTTSVPAALAVAVPSDAPLESTTVALNGPAIDTKLNLPRAGRRNREQISESSNSI